MFSVDTAHNQESHAHDYFWARPFEGSMSASHIECPGPELVQDLHTGVNVVILKLRCLHTIQVKDNVTNIV